MIAPGGALLATPPGGPATRWPGAGHALARAARAGHMRARPARG